PRESTSCASRLLRWGSARNGESWFADEVRCEPEPGGREAVRLLLGRIAVRPWFHVQPHRMLRPMPLGSPLRSLGLFASLALLLLAAPVPRALAIEGSALDSLLASTPADSLRVPLRRLEGRLDPARSAEVAMTLGRYHFARGEYRDAVAAFARSSARLEPSRKPDARYWMGLSWLGLGEPAQARATLEGVAH